MSDSAAPRPLPPRASIEQLRKQAKDRLRQLRAAGSSDVTLADVQLQLARDHGFESWPKLVHHVQATNPAGLRAFDLLAGRVAAAYVAADADGIREINWENGTSFPWFRESERMHERLPTWFASASRADSLALTDARQLVARESGFDTWDNIVRSLSPGRSAPRRAGERSFYDVNISESMLKVRGPLSDRHWDTVIAVMRAEGLTGLNAGGMTDEAMRRVSSLEHVTRLRLAGSARLSDDGLAHAARLPRLRELDLSGPRGMITDRGLGVLRDLPALRRFHMEWAPGITDAGASQLGFCTQLEYVNLMGTSTGDETIRALAAKPRLHHLKTGRLVTDEGIRALHAIPAFNTWRAGDDKLTVMTFAPEHNTVLLDGPFTDDGVRALAGLDGLFGLSFFWHTPAITPAALGPLTELPRLGFLACDGRLLDDRGIRVAASIPAIRMLVALSQNIVAGDDGFAALARSQTFEFLCGGCPNLSSDGFRALSAMPALRGLAIDLGRMEDHALAALAEFAALEQIGAGGLRDDGFRHLGRCMGLTDLWCMGCPTTDDVATEHIAKLGLRLYYAGGTRITDHSLSILGRMTTLESVELEGTPLVTDAGVMELAKLPRLRELRLFGLPRVPRSTAAAFRPTVHVSIS